MIKLNTKLSNPRRVAREIIKTASKGKLVNIEKAMKKVGYSPKSARTNQKRIKDNKDFQDEVFDFVSEMERLRTKAIIELNDPKLRKKMTGRDKIEEINTYSKQINLLTGGITEKVEIDWAG